MRRFLFAFLVAGVTAATFAMPAASAPLRILIIGNSYVSRPNLCGRLERVASAMQRSATCKLIAENDYSLEDHWSDGKVQAAIKEGWDVVVLQQGPSAHPKSRELLLRDVKRFNELIRASGAKPALFSAWPAQVDVDDYPAAIRSSRAAAESIDATLIPVAEAWLRALQRDNRLRLYSDGLHATDQGADLVLLTAWFTLFPAGPQDFTEDYVAKIAKAMNMQARTRDALFDSATRAVDEPMALK